MDMEHTHLEQAERHVAQAQRIIGDQRRRIERMRADGHDVTIAQELLASFERTLEAYRSHREFIRQQIAART